jgi:hypothetical protein
VDHFIVLKIIDDTDDHKYVTTILNWLNGASWDGKTSAALMTPAAYAALIQAVEMALSNMKKVADNYAHGDERSQEISHTYEKFIDALAQAARILGDPFTDNIPDTISSIESS